ncbi:MAG: iron-containing alcohol dehydrogenase [Pontiellaceae bacterium]|nr:iron-containing alcohol dehydrogenase [Pontiellaceae bacterium]MBN2783227.1 iron-containing alcohol dehydrogenase [Pontiellaceae bacterium]
MLEKGTYFLPPINMIGPGVLQDVGEQIKGLGCSKPLLVTDKMLVELGLPIVTIETLSKEVGILSGLKELGVGEDKIPAMAELALADPCAPGNPKEMTLDDAIALYTAAM